MNKQEVQYDKWWKEQTLKGDPRFRPYLVSEAFSAGWKAACAAATITYDDDICTGCSNSRSCCTCAEEFGEPARINLSKELPADARDSVSLPEQAQAAHAAGAEQEKELRTSLQEERQHSERVRASLVESRTKLAYAGGWPGLRKSLEYEREVISQRNGEIIRMKKEEREREAAWQAAAQDLLNWVPVCSIGSEGYRLIEQLKAVMLETTFGKGGSFNQAVGVEADLKHPAKSDTGGEIAEVYSRPECPFNYCDTKVPHTECLKGCRHVEPSGGMDWPVDDRSAPERPNVASAPQGNSRTCAKCGTSWTAEVDKCPECSGPQPIPEVKDGD